MNKEYVKQYVRLEKDHWWFLVRQKIILKFLKKYLQVEQTPGLKVLNVGASGGATSRLLSGFGTVESVETDLFFIEYLKQQQVAVTEASVTSLPFPDNNFDLVCAFDVIEHVADDASAIKEMTRVCKPNGAICITVPAFDVLWSGHDIVNRHYRRYRKKSLEQLEASTQILSPGKTLYFNSLLFLPILIVRKISTIFSKNKNRDTSDFTYFKTSDIPNRFFWFIFGIEVPLLGFPFPFGVSLISLSIKKVKPPIITAK